MTQCCDWKVDLSAEKALLTAPPTEVGDAVVFTHTWANAGPDRARDSVIKDKLSNPPSIGVNNSTVVAMAYTGGATGPATTTYGELVAGVTIPLMPAGSTVTGVFGGTAQVGFDNVVLINQTSIAPGDGHSDTNVLNNTAMVVVTLPGGCYLKCDDRLGTFSNPTAASSFSGCFEATPTGGQIYQSRTGSFIVGGTPPDYSGLGAQYGQATYTNPWEYPCLLECVLVAHPNINASGRQGTFIFGVTDTLNVRPPNTGGFFQQVVQPNFCWINMNSAVNSTALGGGVWPASLSKQQETGTCAYQRVLAPGESVTLYFQYWLIYGASGYYEVHGAMSAYANMRRNVW